MSHRNGITGRSRTVGFTLIELLVVIAIIAILAAILFPVFAKAREKARQITCTSNEKQMGLGFLQYEQDNDELLPGAWKPEDAQGDREYWPSLIYAYTKSTGIFLCPDISQGSHMDTQTAYLGNATLDGVARYTDYSYNDIFFYGGVGGTTNAENSIGVANAMDGDSESQPLAAITSPATTILLTEGNGMKGSGVNTYNTNFTDYTGVFPVGTANWGGNQSYSNVDPRHTNGSNILYQDGHVKWSHNSLDANGNPCHWYLNQSNTPGCSS